MLRDEEQEPVFKIPAFAQTVIAVLFAVVALVLINAVTTNIAYDLGYQAGWVQWRYGGKEENRQKAKEEAETVRKDQNEKTQ